MYKKHTYNSENRCINCGGSKELIESNKWKCSLIDNPAVNGPRIEVSHDFAELESFISKIPSVVHVMGVNEMDNTWTLHIDIELDHNLSSTVIKHIEDVINEMITSDNLPVMLPSVPVDYSDDERQRCIITSEDEYFTPKLFLECIQVRFPNPVADEIAWLK